MTATKVPANARPPMDRKVTRKSEEKREELLDDGLKITIDGEVHIVRDGDVTPQVARELREASGMSYVRLIQTIRRDPDIDVLSAFVWLARRIQGEYVALDDVVVTYDAILEDGFDISQPGAEVVDGNDPES